MNIISAGWAALLRFCALGLFIVAAIIYWGAWTPTTAAGLLSAGLACLAASFLFVPERTTRPHTGRRTMARESDGTYDEPLTRERVTTGRRERV